LRIYHRHIGEDDACRVDHEHGILHARVRIVPIRRLALSRTPVALALVALLAATLPGCAGRQAVKGSRSVVERSVDRKPDWVERRSWEDNGRVWVVGASGTVKDVALGEEIATATAKRTIAESVGQAIRSEFRAATTGNPNAERLGRAVDSALSLRTDRVIVRGVMPTERYWERYEVITDDGVASGLEVSMLCSVSKDDLAASRKQELQVLAQSEQLKADAEARKLLESLRTQP